MARAAGTRHTAWIRSLDLGGNNLGIAGLHTLSAALLTAPFASKLTNLDLWGNKLGDEGVVLLLGLLRRIASSTLDGGVLQLAEAEAKAEATPGSEKAREGALERSRGLAGLPQAAQDAYGLALSLEMHTRAVRPASAPRPALQRHRRRRGRGTGGVHAAMHRPVARERRRPGSR